MNLINRNNILIRVKYVEPLYYTKYFQDNDIWKLKTSFKIRNTLKSIRFWIFYTSKDNMKGAWKERLIRVLGVQFTFRKYEYGLF